MRGHARPLVEIAILLLLCVIWMLPLLGLGRELWLTHTSWYDACRMMGVAQAWRSGLWDARWFPGFDHGYGYPFLSFYAPLFHWISGVFYLATGSPSLVLRFQIYVWLSVGVVGIYAASERLWGWTMPPDRSRRPVGLCAALGLLSVAYPMCNVYVRGAFPEFASSMMLPWILWGVVAIFQPARSAASVRPAWQLSLLLAVAIILHNFYGLVAAGFCVASIAGCTAIRWMRRKDRPATAMRVALAATALLASLVLTVFFWLPAMREQRFVHIDTAVGPTFDFRIQFLYISNLLRVNYWDYYWSVAGPADTMPLHLGYVSIVAFLVAMTLPVTMLATRPAPSARLTAAIGFVLAGTLFSILMTMSISRPIYEAFPLLETIQFPWRFLGLSSVGVALVLPVAYAWLPGYGWRLYIYPAMLLVVFLFSHFRYGKYLTELPLGDYLSYEEWENLPIRAVDIDDYGPIWRSLERKPEWPPRHPLETEDVEVFQFEDGLVAQELIIENQGGEVKSLTFAINYFPGWQAWIGGDADHIALDVEPEPDTGFLRIKGIPPGTHRLYTRFGDTPIRRTTRVVSGVAWLLWLVAGALLLFRRSSA